MKKPDIKEIIKLKEELEAFCRAYPGCVGCPYESSTIYTCYFGFALQREYEKQQESMSCKGCINYNEGEGSDVCDGCCRNYEEDRYDNGVT